MRHRTWELWECRFSWQSLGPLSSFSRRSEPVFTGKGSSDNYPCDIPTGDITCEDALCIDQSTGASPLVTDCQMIIRNIERVGHPGREILSYGNCAFGIEATKTTGMCSLR
jgi:hypothetical protein